MSRPSPKRLPGNVTHLQRLVSSLSKERGIPPVRLQRWLNDGLLVEDLLRQTGLHRAREACVDIFALRDKHSWPPTITVYESWRGPFTALAREHGFTPEDVDEAAARLTALIAAIDAAKP